MSWTPHRTLNRNVNWNDRKKNILDCNSKKFKGHTLRADYFLSVSIFPSCKPASHRLAPFQRLCRIKALIEVANRFYSQLHNKIQMSGALVNVFQCHNVLMLDPEKNRWNIWSITANQSRTWVDYEGFVMDGRSSFPYTTAYLLVWYVEIFYSCRWWKQKKSPNVTR